MNAYAPTRQNWCTAEPALTLTKSAIGDVAAERGVRPEDRLVADVAVVRHVHVVHEQVAVADRRHAAAAGGAAVDGDELAEDVARADLEAGRLRPCTSGPAAPGQSRRTGTLRCRRRSWCGRRSPPTRRSCSCGRCATCGPITANGPDRSCRRRSPRSGWTRACGSMWVPIGDTRQQQLGLHHGLPVDFGERRGLHQRTARGAAARPRAAADRRE